MVGGEISIKGGQCVLTTAKGHMVATHPVDNDLYKLGKAQCKEIIATSILITSELTQI